MCYFNLELHNQIERDRAKIATLGRAATSALAVHQAMLRHPIADITKLKELTGLTNATIGKVLNALLDFGIIEETTGNKRNRLFCYNRYMESLRFCYGPVCGPPQSRIQDR